MKEKTMTADLRVLRGSLLAMLLGLASCDDSRTCLDYACFSGVMMTWKLGSAGSNRVFDVRMCRGDTCEDKVVTVPDDDTQACDGSSHPHGSLSDTSACVVRQGNGVVFSANWTYNEGLPPDKTFDLRIVDRESAAFSWKRRESRSSRGSRPWTIATTAGPRLSTWAKVDE